MWWFSWWEAGGGWGVHGAGSTPQRLLFATRRLGVGGASADTEEMRHAFSRFARKLEGSFRPRPLRAAGAAGAALFFVGAGGAARCARFVVWRPPLPAGRGPLAPPTPGPLPPPPPIHLPNHAPSPNSDAPAASPPPPSLPGESPADVGGASPAMMIFSGNANKELAAEIAAYLGTSLGSITVARFADGEVNCQVHDNVRGKDVFIIQPTCPPVNEHLMELLLMVSTMRRASAERITCVIPYYGYARQDRKMIARVPISAADVARLLEAMGVDRVVAVDLHCGQIQGFFGPRVPVDNLDAANVGVRYFANKGLVNPVVVSPDAGGVYRCVRGCGPRAPPRAPRR